MTAIGCFIRCALALGLAAMLTPSQASPIEYNDAQIDHYELKEKITRTGTRIDYNYDQSVRGVDSHGNVVYHEVNHDVFDTVLAPVAGNDPNTNNNGLFYEDVGHTGGTASFTYTHFLSNPNLDASLRSRIVGFNENSLIEFALKLDFHDLTDNSLVSVWALPVIEATASNLTLASHVTAKDLKDLKFRFNLYDDFGNATTIASLNALGAIIAASPDGGIKIDINVDHTSDLRLESSEIELEYVAIPEPAVWTLIVAVLGFSMFRRRHVGRHGAVPA